MTETLSLGTWVCVKNSLEEVYAMQRYAFSKEGVRVFAEEALSQVDYFCPECLEKVRVRRGEIKIAHFYHFEGAKECRWKTRFQTHTTIQEELVRRLGNDNCTVERFFPEISRIADVAFHPQKIVFEIQVSPISAGELISRTLDYWKTGWHVIWILHTEQFGSRRGSAAEETVQNIPHYFADIGPQGLILWDEASYVHKRKRIWFTPLSRKRFFSLVPIIHKTPPSSAQEPRTHSTTNAWFKHREETWSCSLQGDFLTEECPQNLSLPTKLPSGSDLLQRLRCFFFLLWIKISGAR